MKGIGIKSIKKFIVDMPRGDNSLMIYTDADNTSTFDPSWAFSDASVMTVNWGDGTPEESHATGLSHTYGAGLGRHLVRFSCPDWTKLDTFDINTDVCRLSLPSFAICTGLTRLTAHTNQFVDTLLSFAACVVLDTLSIGGNQFSGILQGFATCTALHFLYADVNLFSGYEVGGFATQVGLAGINLWGNNLLEASIDAILADLVISLAIPARVVCNLNLSGGTNAAPSNPAGLASKATLVAAGWVCTTN